MGKKKRARQEGGGFFESKREPTFLFDKRRYKRRKKKKKKKKERERERKGVKIRRGWRRWEHLIRAASAAINSSWFPKKAVKCITTYQRNFENKKRTAKTL